MNAERLIRFLIRLYPASFRARYGDAMLVFHRERAREGAAWWIRVILDHLTSALVERVRSMSTVLHDVRFALRGLARRPLFAIVVLTTIALGVGANTAIFSVVRGILLRPLPYPHPERVVSFGHKPNIWLASQPEYIDYKRDLRTFTTLAAYTKSEGNLATEQEPERIAVSGVTPDFFTVLGLAPALGRYFAADDDIPVPSTLVVISHALWQRRFGGDSGIVGKTISFNGRPRTVIGVMPKHFDYPTARTDIWVPMPRPKADSLGDRGNHYLFMVGRLRPDVTLDHAVAEATALAKRQMTDNANRYDPNQPLVPVIARVNDKLVGGTRPYLWALVGAVGFVLLIVCANVANLLLARGEGRRKEMALRTALGASSGRLIMQLITESVVLALVGGALGLLLAWAGMRGLIALAPDSIPRLDEIAIDGTVLGFTLALALGTGLLFGVVPAIYAAREAPADALKEGGKTMHHAGSRRMRRALVAAEVALAVITLTGAGMLLRSLANLEAASLGFEPHSVLTAKVSPLGNYEEARTITFYSQLLARVRAIPGVTSAGAAGWLPVVEVGGLWGVLGEGQSYATMVQGPSAAPQQVTPGYFAAMGMPMVKGREFTDDDRPDGPFVGIVSKSLAQLLFPNAEPIGRRFRLGGTEPFVTVVGVVNDTRAHGFGDATEPTMYFAYSQTSKSAYFLPRAMSLVIRTRGEPLALAAQVRAIVKSLDPAVPVSNVRTLEAVVGTSVANRRFSTALIATFATLALVLAGIGIYGVISFGVSERTFEIGVRMALGAERSRVLTLVVRDGVSMAIVGGAVGLAGAVVLARAIESMLVDVHTVDVPTMVIVSAALAVVVVVASVVPARRALGVSPTDALRGG
jgi:putative ABC transport system permease protein